MAIIENEHDWWSLYEHRRGEIADIASKVGLDMDSVSEGRDQSLGALMNIWTLNRKHEDVWKVLNQIWDMAPDRPEIHSWPGWGDLCDLCSEIWVFGENQ